MQQIVCRVVREPEPQEGSGFQVTGPDDVRKLVGKVMDTLTGEEAREIFVVFHLNSQSMVVAWEIVTQGILDASLVHPREIYRSAIVRNAAAIIVAHNHPSGLVEPSGEDLKVTRQLVNAGDQLGMPLVDHVITGRDFSTGEPRYHSLAAEGFFGRVRNGTSEDFD